MSTKLNKLLVADLGLSTRSTVREIQIAIRGGENAHALCVQLGVLPSQFVRIAGELRAREMTVNDYLSEHDVERDRPSGHRDDEILRKLEAGIVPYVPYVYEADKPVVPSWDQQVLATDSWFAETMPATNRWYANRMMGMRDPVFADLEAVDDDD